MFRRLRRPLGLSLVLLVLVIGYLTFIEHHRSTERESTDRRAEQQFAADLAQWRLPLSDKYVKSDALFNAYAENVFLSECARSHGTSIPVAPVRIDEQLSPMFNTDLRRLFNAGLAARHGYRVTGYYQRSIPDVTVAPDQQRVWTQCLKNLRLRYPAPPTTGVIQAIETDAYLRAKKSAGVIEASDRWRDCMTARNIADLTTSPEQMPSPKIMKRLRIAEDLGGRPTSMEIDLAVSDARCRETSGFDQALFATEAELQLQGEKSRQQEVDQEADLLSAYHRDMQAIVDAAAGRLTAPAAQPGTAG